MRGMKGLIRGDSPQIEGDQGRSGRVAPDCHSSAALSGLHLGGVAPNGHGTIIRARDLVIPHADARARAVANLADLGATCPK